MAGKPPEYLAQVSPGTGQPEMKQSVYIRATGPITADQVLLQGQNELQKSLPAEQRKLVTWDLARVAHRNGRLSLRDGGLKAYQNLPTLTALEQEYVVYFGSQLLK